MSLLCDSCGERSRRFGSVYCPACSGKAVALRAGYHGPTDSGQLLFMGDGRVIELPEQDNRSDWRKQIDWMKSEGVLPQMKTYSNLTAMGWEPQKLPEEWCNGGRKSSGVTIRRGEPMPASITGRPGTRKPSYQELRAAVESAKARRPAYPGGPRYEDHGIGY